MKRLGYIPSLDGLRGIAIILVMLSHTPFGLFRTSGLGVDVFFALSGFLITTLIIQEYDRTNSVNLLAFYKRRALRLLPCLYAVLAVVVAISFLAPALMPPGTVEQAATASVYIANWHLALAPFFTDTPLAHTWSLAVEDQFYIIWAPLLVLALIKRIDRRVMIALVATAAFISTLLCAVMINQPDGYDRAYFGTDSRSHALLIGCVAGLIFTASNIQIPKRLLWLAVVPGASFLMWITAESIILPAVPVSYSLSGGTMLLALSVAAICLLVASGEAGVLDRIFSFRPLVWVGSISYGLYLWHYPIFWLLGRWAGSDNLIVFPFGAMALSLVVAALSYRFIEKPFLRLKYTNRDKHPQLPEVIQSSIVSQ